MYDRSKYSLNGVYQCEDFEDRVGLSDFPRVPIGSAGGINEWYITFLVERKNNLTLVYPCISCDNKPALLLRCFFRVIRTNGSSCFEWVGRSIYSSDIGPIGLYMNIRALTRETYGYLDYDGALTVEYGIHVEAILGEDKIWKFNIYDKFFSSSSQNQMVELRDAWAKWYTHKQFFTNIRPKEFQSHIFLILDKRPVENLLQIMHGVRVRFSNNDFNEILPIARSQKLHNVIQYCDQQMIEYSCQSPVDFPSFEFLDEVVAFGLRRSLGQLVKKCETLEELVRAIKMMDIKKMSGEAMKTFAAKIFTRKF